MFHVLIESGAHPGERRAGWTVASAVVHASLIAAAVALTMPPWGSTSAPPPVLEDDPLPRIRIWREPEPLAPKRVGESPGTLVVPRFPHVPIPAIPINLPGTVPTGLPDSLVFGRVWDVEGTGVQTRPVPTDVYTVGAVDRPVAPRNDNGGPVYPSRLLSAGIEGFVGVRYVVDSTGRVEAGSITILETTHTAFAEAVGKWLLRARYLPAEANGRPVRQLVEQRFAFFLRI